MSGGIPQKCSSCGGGCGGGFNGKPCQQHVPDPPIAYSKGLFRFVREGGKTNVLYPSGGTTARYGDGYLAFGLALGALHDAMAMLGIGPAYGPAPVSLVLPHDQFVKLRDALVGECDAAKVMFRRPRRKRIDPDIVVTMFHGITIASDQAPVDSLPLGRCPSIPAAATSEGGAR